MTARYKASFKSLTVTALAGALALLSACATTKVSPEARSYYSQTQQTLHGQSASIIGDGCILRGELGTSHILYEQSEIVIAGVTKALKDALTERNIQTDDTLLPFVCGAVTNDDLDGFDVKYTIDGEREKVSNYPLLSSSNQYDTQTNNALRTLLLQVKATKASEDGAVNLNLDATTRAQLQSTLGIDKVFIVSVEAYQPSFGKNMALGMATLIATGGSSYLSAQLSTTYDVYLVDLASNKLLWKKPTAHLDRNIFKKPISSDYEKTQDLLVPLYENTAQAK